ncbi:hypothetical protein ANCDUO_07265 [Ancylostoma duodenale]|uniref:Uncharacterized protein n=1 Tax=Ancylostoma duodenale TaxID=51022 RepID=A0A0C2GMI7_9BILA|nr:hypothetical protein ANCDUO_07265 [Ancylostoma duodenale]
MKGVFGGEGSFVERVKNATGNGFGKILDRAGLRKIQEKISSMKGKIMKTLELSPEMLQSLKERLKKLRFIKVDKIKEEGDSNGCKQTKLLKKSKKNPKKEIAPNGKH